MAVQFGSRRHTFSNENLIDLIKFHAPISSIQTLLQKGVNVNARDSRGYTPLMIACLLTQEPIIRLLINYGANVTYGDSDRNTVLHHASRFGWIEIIRLLAKNRVDLNARNSKGETGLHVAARSVFQSAALKCLVKYGANIDQRDSVNFTPLMCAAARSKKNEFDLLLESGAKIENGDVFLLLYCASRNSWTGVFSSLLKRIPDLEESLGKSEVILNPRLSEGHLELVKFLVGEGTDGDAAEKQMICQVALRRAAADGHLDVVTLLVKRVTDLNGGDQCGRTALHHAASNGSLPIVCCLVEGGAHVNRTDDQLETPLFKVTRNVEVAKYLVKKGANLCARNDIGATPLFKASATGFLEMVEYLVELGVDYNMGTVDGISPLLCAVQQNHKYVVDYLMHLGASFAGSIQDYSTVLHLASRKGWTDTVRSVLKRGCDLDARNVYGVTALHCATEVKKLDVVQLLLQAGANWNIADMYGRSPLNYLTTRQRPEFELLKLFLENGAYLKPIDYNSLIRSSSLEVLQDVKLSCQAIINKFNYRDLPDLYKFPASRILPRLEEMKIVHGTEVAQAMERTVAFEVRTKGHCNVFQVRPMPLSVLSVAPALEYYRKKAEEIKKQLKLQGVGQPLCNRRKTY